MKRKLTLIALAALTLAPATVSAEGWTQYVTNKSEFDNALAAFTGTNGETCTIVVVKAKNDDGTFEPADNSVVIRGNYGVTSAQMANLLDGTLVITSNATSIDNQPRLQLGFNMPTQAADSHLSLVFRNVSVEYRADNTATSGQVIYWNKQDCHADSIIFDGCNIANIPRTLIRTVPAQVDGVTNSDNTLHTFKMIGCKVHDNNITSGNQWATVYLGVTTDEIIIKDNMFYNMPFSKNILTYNYCEPTGAGTRVDFENNTVVIAKGTATADFNGPVEANVGFSVIGVGQYLGTMAQYNINNNLFLTPQVGEYPVWGTLSQKGMVNFSEYGETVILSCTGGIISAANNVAEGYAPWSAGNNKDKETGEGTWLVYPQDGEGIVGMADAGLSWSDFYDAANSDFRMLKSHALYNMGRVSDESGMPTAETTCVGSSLMYVDKFPQKSSITVNIAGSNAVDYTISPVKENYESGDEVTITLKDHNSYYRTINTFKGWNDGSMENPRTVTLDGNVVLTATYESMNNIVNLVDFSRVTGNINGEPASYESDVFMDEAHKAIVTYMATDTVGLGEGTKVAPFEYVEATQMQARAAKFGEDPVEKQMPVVSRRSPAVANVAGQPNYIVVAFSTKDIKDVAFSCFVGTDNHAFENQYLEYSLDKQAWTRFAEVVMVKRDTLIADTQWTYGGWTELKGDLPAAAENQDVVYVRVISDPNSPTIFNPVAGTKTKEADETFEYVGSILITHSASDGIFNISDNQESKNTPVYNIMGIRVNDNARGLLIKNGRKYIVR